MAASIVIKDEAKKRRARSIGLIPEHSYGLLSAAEIVDKAGKKVQLVKLRNPWGTFEWRGDYSGNSDCWTEEQREELEVSEENDGTFWMRFQDMKIYFNCIEYARVKDDYRYSFITI